MRRPTSEVFSPTDTATRPMIITGNEALEAHPTGGEILKNLSAIQHARKNLERIFCHSPKGRQKIEKYDDWGGQPRPVARAKGDFTYGVDVDAVIGAVTRDVTKDGKLPFTAKRENEIEAVMDMTVSKLENTWMRLTAFEAKLFSDKKLQAKWKESFSRESIKNQEDADKMIVKELHPFVSLWEKTKTQLRRRLEEERSAIKSTGKTTFEEKDIPNLAAWETVGMENPLAELATEKQNDFKEMLSRIFLLPGRHQELKKQFFSSGAYHCGSAEAVAELLKSFNTKGENVVNRIEVNMDLSEINALIDEAQKNLPAEPVKDEEPAGAGMPLAEVAKAGVVATATVVEQPVEATAEATTASESENPRRIVTRRGVRGIEQGTTDFTYNRAEAERLHLELLELPAYTAAEATIEKVVDKTINITTAEGQQAFLTEWQQNCPNLPLPCIPPNDWWYLTRLSEGRIITNLSGQNKVTQPNYGRQEKLLIDNWQEEDYDATNPDRTKKLQTIISPLLQELLGQNQVGVVNIKRQDVDSALWEGDPGNRQQSEHAKAIIRRLGADPEQVELRCLKQSEHSRGSLVHTNWGTKNLYTNYDDYFLGDGGDRLGLCGGAQGAGGVSKVDYAWRGAAGGGLAVRLVLSRKQ